MLTIDGLKFKTEPWPHQLAALKFFMPRSYGALYTEPGTGKSKVFIDLIENRDFQRVVIVGTKKPCQTWEKQFKLHSMEAKSVVLQLLGMPSGNFIPEVTKALYSVSQVVSRKRLIIIVTYGSIWRGKFVDFLVKKFKPDCVICDESHKIKSPGSKCSRALTKLGRYTPNRYNLTGTPLAERPEDAYAQYRFLQPKIFGTRLDDFKARYQNIDPHATARVGYPILNKKQPYKNMDEFTKKFWKPAFKIPSSVKLPKRKNIIVDFEMSPKGVKAYKLIEKEGAIDTSQGELLIDNVLSKVIRRQQATSGFIPLQNEAGEVKLYNTDDSRMEALRDLLDELHTDEPIVVFARFKKDLKNIRKVCKELGRGYSEISGREDTEAEWQTGKTSVIGVQYVAGSESVDLTRARYLIYYSLTHSLLLYLQSKKRIHRPGQDRMCVYYYLAALCNGKKTIDHQIIHAWRRKQNIVDEIEKGRTRL